MKLKLTVLTILLFIVGMISNHVYARGNHHESPQVTPTTTATSSTPLILPAQNTYGLLALPNIPFDWGVPDKVQVGGTVSFTEGGNQSFAVGAANRFGGILVHVKFSGLVDGPDNADDYAISVGGVARF